MSTSLSQSEEIAALQDRVRILQKYGGGLSDEQIDSLLDQERWKAEAPERKRLIMEERVADRTRIEKQCRKIAEDELGRHIVVSLNKSRVDTLTPGGGVPCPGCGIDLGFATTALMEIADLIRGNGGNDGHTLIGQLDRATGQGVPCVHTGGSCPHCGTGVDVLVQLVIA